MDHLVANDYNAIQCDLEPVAVLCWGQGAQTPLNLAHPQIFRVITVHKLLNTGQLDTVVLLVVASQMMRRQAPKYFS